VKSPPFEYHAVASVDEALALLAAHGDDAKVLAGGQSLLPLLGLRLAHPEHLVDVGRVSALGAIAVNGSVRIGSAVRQRVAERSAPLAAANPLLAIALPLIGHAPIRNRGTIGGSVAHADPAAELPAVMLLSDAELELRSTAGTRVVTAADFFQGFLTTALRSDELLVELRLPAWPSGAGASFQEIVRRNGDFALVGAGAVVQLDRTTGGTGRITAARLAFIGVGSTAVRASTAESALLGQEPTADTFAAAAQMAAAELDPSSDIHATGAYRRHVARVLAGRVLQEATNNAH
jgi:aerobic carbon-monoxide dehydrogenase medium subunit